MKNKNLITQIVAFIACFLIANLLIYIIGSFAWATFDLTKWDYIGRGTFVVIFEVAAIGISLATASEF